MSFIPQSPGDTAAGRGSLLLGLLFIGLGAAIAALQAKLVEGAFWALLGVFFLCYGAISLDWQRLPRTLLLTLGMLSGGAALLIAITQLL